MFSAAPPVTIPAPVVVETTRYYEIEGRHGRPPSTRARADRHHVLGAARMLDLHRFDSPPQSLQDLLRCGAVVAAHQGDEFLAAVPCHDHFGLLARLALQRMRDGGKAVVAGKMAVGVVE